MQRQRTTLAPEAIAAAADLLVGLRQRRPRGERIAELPEHCRPQTLADGYAIQDEVVARLCAEHGGQRIGWKVACTNAIAQEALAVGHPMFGQLLSHSTSTSPVVLPADAFTTRVIECEFGLRIGRTVPASELPYTAMTIVDHVSEVLPAIEVVDHRFVDWSLGAPSIAADNAIHGWWVHGAPFQGDWHTLDLATHPLEARIDGELVGEGTGAAVLGHPLNVLAWLANELPRYGHQLVEGDLVTTGVCTDVFSADRPSTVLADFGSLGTVSLHWG